MSQACSLEKIMSNYWFWNIIYAFVFRTYRINLVALSATADFDDSAKSNTLVISNSKGPGSITLDEHTSAGDDELPLKVTGVTESGIHLDWSSYIENTDVAFYKIQWSSVAQPTVSFSSFNWFLTPVFKMMMRISHGCESNVILSFTFSVMTNILYLNPAPPPISFSSYSCRRYCVF